MDLGPLKPDARTQKAESEARELETLGGQDGDFSFGEKVRALNFFTAHQRQAQRDVRADSGNRGNADNEYQTAVAQLQATYQQLNADGLSSEDVERLRGQAQNVVAASVDSYVEQQTGEDPGNF